MRSLIVSLGFAFALLVSTQNADARYLIEMGGFNLHPYANGSWQSQPASSAPIGHRREMHFGRQSFQQPGWIPVADGGYVDGYNLYQYAQDNPCSWRDPTGLWTAADCLRRYNDCMGAANDDYAACKRDGRSHALCTMAYLARVAACDASYAACLAGSDEGLKCIGTGCVIAGAGLLSQCDSPVPGPCDAAAAGIIGWWMCTPEDEPGDPQVR